MFATIIRLDVSAKEQNNLEKIVLCDVQNEIYPEIEKTFLTLLHRSGYPDLKFNKKVNFEDLYNKNKISNNFFQVLSKYSLCLLISF